MYNILRRLFNIIKGKREIFYEHRITQMLESRNNLYNILYADVQRIIDDFNYSGILYTPHELVIDEYANRGFYLRLRRLNHHGDIIEDWIICEITFEHSTYFPITTFSKYIKPYTIYSIHQLNKYIKKLLSSKEFHIFLATLLDEFITYEVEEPTFSSDTKILTSGMYTF